MKEPQEMVEDAGRAVSRAAERVGNSKPLQAVADRTQAVASGIASRVDTDKIAGKTKELVGAAIRNDDLRDEGRRQQAKGLMGALRCHWRKLMAVTLGLVAIAVVRSRRAR